MSTITDVETTPQAIEELAGRIFMEGVGAFHLGTVYIGLKHGLFAALVEDGPLTAGELAIRTGLTTASFTTAPGVREALLDETHPAFIGGLPLATAAGFSVMPELLKAFQSGAGVPYASYGRRGRGAGSSEATHARTSRPARCVSRARWR